MIQGKEGRWAPAMVGSIRTLFGLSSTPAHRFLESKNAPRSVTFRAAPHRRQRSQMAAEPVVLTEPMV